MFVYAYSKAAFCVKNCIKRCALERNVVGKVFEWFCAITSFLSTYLSYLSFGLCPQMSVFDVFSVSVLM